MLLHSSGSISSGNRSSRHGRLRRDRPERDERDAVLDEQPLRFVLRRLRRVAAHRGERFEHRLPARPHLAAAARQLIVRIGEWLVGLEQLGFGGSDFVLCWVDRRHYPSCWLGVRRFYSVGPAQIECVRKLGARERLRLGIRAGRMAEREEAREPPALRLVRVHGETLEAAAARDARRDTCSPPRRAPTSGRRGRTSAARPRGSSDAGSRPAARRDSARRRRARRRGPSASAARASRCRRST